MQFFKHWSIVGKVILFYVGDQIKTLKLIFTCEGLYFGQFSIIAQVIIEMREILTRVKIYSLHLRSFHKGNKKTACQYTSY